VTAPTVLIVAAHPDDRCWLRRHRARRAAAARPCTWRSSHGPGGARATAAPSTPGAAALREDARAWAACSAPKSVSFADFPDNRFDTVALLDVVKQVERWLAEIAPGRRLHAPSGDLNVDHRLTFQAV